MMPLTSRAGLEMPSSCFVLSACRVLRGASAELRCARFGGVRLFAQLRLLPRQHDDLRHVENA